jgi:hypothetical protein
MTPIVLRQNLHAVKRVGLHYILFGKHLPLFMSLPGLKNPKNWQNLHRVAKLGSMEDGRFLRYSPRRVIRDFVLERPDLFFDGKYWEDAYSTADFGLVLVDEAHHIGAASFQKALQLLAPPMVAGCTATPCRGDSYDIDSILGPALVKVGIDEGLRRGFLAEVDYRLMADNLARLSHKMG